MKHSLFVGMVGGVLLLGGCQSLNWTAKNKSRSDSSMVQAENVREVPWTWSRKKKPSPNTEMPSDIAAKFDKMKQRPGSAKTAAEWVIEGGQQEVARNFAAARKSYEAALNVDPVNADAHHRLGILADMRQEYGEAQDHYEAAMRQRPRDPNLLSDLGYSHQLQGSVHQSERYLLQALDADPQHRQALKNLGALYAGQGRYDDAQLAFRRFRPDEAPQLLAQFFPNGRTMPPGDNAQIAATANPGGPRGAPPMPPDNVDQTSLKNMSMAEIRQIMDQRRQQEIQAREQKALAELRPNLQPSLTKEEVAQFSSTPPQQNGWDQNNNSGRSVPPSLGQSAGRPTASSAVADNNSSQQDMKFWQGAPLQQRPAASSGNGLAGPNGNAMQPSWPAGSRMPPAATSNAAASPSQSSPWADNAANGQANSPDAVAETGGFDTPRNSLNDGDHLQALWNQAGTAQQPPPRASAASSLSPSQRAYQLGMSAGPGTMFPVVPNQAAATAQNSGMSGGQWSDSTGPGGYLESKPSASGADGQWQDAQTEVAPRSPSESWGSPSSDNWPSEPAAAAPITRAAAPSRPTTAQMPVITPAQGLSPWSNAAVGGQRNGNSPNRSAADFDRGTAQGTNVTPAWFDSPVAEQPPPSRYATPPANSTTTVPQWPYAPR